MQPSQQPSAIEAVVLLPEEESSDLLVALPDQIPSVESGGSTLLSQEDLPTVAVSPMELEAPVQGVIPGSSQDQVDPVDEVGDDWRYCYVCGSTDHFARKCPLNPSPPWLEEEAAVDWSSADLPDCALLFMLAIAP